MRVRKRSVALTLAALALPAMLAVYARAAGAPLARLTWYGQSCFLLESASGTRILMDPMPAGIGYDPPQGLRADAITISHEHADHTNVALVGGKPKILRGLTADKKGWSKIDEKIKDVGVRSVGVYHDQKRGAERGLDTVFVFETGGLRIAHLGDLGHLLDDQQLAAIGNVDVALIPVGGFYTIDATQATKVVEQLRPRLVVIPMHFRTDVLTIKELAPVDAFLAGKPDVRREKGNTLELSGLKTGVNPRIVVLGYK